MELQLIHCGSPMIYECARGGVGVRRWTFSYIPEQDAIVMNKNHKNYEDYKEKSFYQWQEVSEQHSLIQLMRY